MEYRLSRLCRVGVAFLLAATGLCLAAQDMRKLPATWWPDPATDLMWTGSPVGGNSLKQPEAVSACRQLTLQGYTGWHLPTIDQYAVVTLGKSGPSAVPEPNRHGAGYHTVDGPDINYTTLKFVPDPDVGMYWSTTPGPKSGELRIVILDYYIGVYGRTPDHSKNVGALCVRTMEPELAALAKQAKPPVPVTGLAQLQSLALLATAAQASAASQWVQQQATDQQALALDPKSTSAMANLAWALGYQGKWDQAVTTLKAARKLDSVDPLLKTELSWAMLAQKEARTDPNVTKAWDLFQQAESMHDKKDFVDAEAVAEQVIQLEPAWPQGYEALGQAYSGIGRWSDAVTALTQAKKLDKGRVTTAGADLSTARRKAHIAEQFKESN